MSAHGIAVQGQLDHLDLTPLGETVLDELREGIRPEEVARKHGLLTRAIRAFMRIRMDDDERSRLRALQAERLVQEALEIADGEKPITIEDPDLGAVPLVDSKRDALRVNTRTWIAERLDRANWAANAKVGVEINLHSLHLDALRATRVQQADVIDI